MGFLRKPNSKITKLSFGSEKKCFFYLIFEAPQCTNCAAAAPRFPLVAFAHFQGATSPISAGAAALPLGHWKRRGWGMEALSLQSPQAESAACPPIPVSKSISALPQR